MGRSGKRAGTLSSLSVTMVPLRNSKVASASTGHSPAATTCERSHFPISFHSSFFSPPLSSFHLPSPPPLPPFLPKPCNSCSNGSACLSGDWRNWQVIRLLSLSSLGVTRAGKVQQGEHGSQAAGCCRYCSGSRSETCLPNLLVGSPQLLSSRRPHRWEFSYSLHPNPAVRV